MTETTLGLDEEWPLNLFNVLYVSLAVIGSLALAFFGVQGSDLELITIGLIFAVAGIVGVAITRGELLTGPGTMRQLSFAYWIAHLPFLIPQALGNVQFSAFSAPTDSYLSILQQTTPEVQQIVNIFLAPSIENVAFIGLMGTLFLAFEYEFDWGKLVSMAAALVIGGVSFALLHGVRTPGFFLLATAFMALWGFVVFAHDLDLFEASIVPYGLSVGFGMHKGNNMAAEGLGVTEFWVDILGASEPVSLFSAGIVLLELVLLYFAVRFVADNAWKMARG